MSKVSRHLSFVLTLSLGALASNAHGAPEDAEPAPASGGMPQPAAPVALSSSEPGPRTASSQPDEAALDVQFWGGLASWAAGTALVITFTYAFFRLNDVVKDERMTGYRAGVAAGESACEAARAGTELAAASPSAADITSLCDEADSMEALRNITLPLGLVLGVAGLALLGTSDTVSGPGHDSSSASSRRWRLDAGAGPAGASASFAWAF